MVATRRQVQTGSELDLPMDQDPDQILKRKPTRKTTAKTSTAETKKATTRGRNKVTEQTLETAEEAPLAKVTIKTAAARGKKIAVADDEVQEQKTRQTTKSGSVRSRRGDVLAEELEDESDAIQVKASKSTKERKATVLDGDMFEPQERKPSAPTRAGSVRGRKASAVVDRPNLPAPDESKPARKTRGAAAKAAPLSPKKITQVKATRTTRNTAQKGGAPVPQGRTTTSTRGGARKRTVSDENAGVSTKNSAEMDAEVDKPAQTAQTPIRKTQFHSSAERHEDVDAESEISMSSAPTTPNDSPAQSFNTIEEQDDAQEDNDSIDDGASDAQEDGRDSEDELCGPKTPMKRLSPTAQARYQSSVQRTIRKYENDIALETPARRFAVLGSQRGTPQTQKPYCRPAAPPSTVRPMTSDRAARRPLGVDDQSNGTPNLQNLEESLEDLDVSFIPDDSIIPMNEVQMIEETIYPPSYAESAVTDEPSSMANISMNDDEEGYVVPADVEMYDDGMDDTVIVHETQDVTCSPHQQAADSFETDDTVIISRPDGGACGAESERDSTAIMTSPDHSVHEMAVKGREVASPRRTIAVDFDEYLSSRRSPERLRAETESLAAAFYDADAQAGAESTLSYDQAPLDITRRQTLNFNDFFDVGALAEPTAQLHIDLDCAQDLHMGSTDQVSTTPSASNAPAQQPESTTFTDEEPKAAQPAHDPETTSTDDHADMFDLSRDVTYAESVEIVNEPEIPHYARPTIAFDARRKSLPVSSLRTPTKAGTRPHTSDGASMPRIVNPSAHAWWARSRAGSTHGTPVKPRPSTAHATPVVSRFSTPVKSSQPSRVTSPAKATPGERYPLLGSRQTYAEHAKTVAAPARFATPNAKSPKRRETFHRAMPGMQMLNMGEAKASSPPSPIAQTPGDVDSTPRARGVHINHAKTVAPVRFHTPAAAAPHRRQRFHKALSGQLLEAAGPEPSTPMTPSDGSAERFPKLPYRSDQMEHAKTVVPAARFHTPAKTSLKRPATMGKGDALRKAVLFANTPTAARNSVKTPLKAAAATPSQAPMTPHPAAPLRGVMALVEVFTLEGASASAPFVALLHRLGAKTTRTWNERISHVVFKDGSPTTLQRVRLNNKEFEECGKGNFVHCVNSRWVTDCDRQGTHMDETEEAYVVDVSEVPRGGKRRRKSMEPSALLNVGGNIVRERKSSAGRVSSFDYSPVKYADSTGQASEGALNTTPNAAGVLGKENSGDEHSSPVTPAWISAPDQLVQQTAPMKRVRKLELPGNESAKNRRLTYWSGAA